MSIGYFVRKTDIGKFIMDIFRVRNMPKRKKGILFPFLFMVILFRRILKYNDIACIDFVITTRCSLKCKHCSNLMQFYGEDTIMADDYKTDVLCTDVSKLLELSDRIWQLIIIGGEPLMNKDLPQILKQLVPLQKIRFINIITNGTIVPSEELIEVCKNRKIQITVSDYGDVAKNKNNVLKILKENKIRHTLLENGSWINKGKVEKRCRSIQELTDIFSLCGKCTTFMNGKIYHCEVYSNGVNLGYIEESKDEIIDIRNISKNDFPAALEIFRTRKYIHACDYCGEVTRNENNTVKPGIQME